MLLRKIELKFQLLIDIFGFNSLTGLVKIWYNELEVETGSVKFKMAASEPESFISRLVDETETKSQRLNLHFRGQTLQ